MLPMVAIAQHTSKWYATGYKGLLFETNGVWDDWERLSWEDTHIVITFKIDTDWDTGRITIYSKSTQRFDLIYANSNTGDTDDGRKAAEWYAEDEDGVNCTVRYVKSGSSNMEDLLIVRYINIAWAYTIVRQ